MSSSWVGSFASSFFSSTLTGSIGRSGSFGISMKSGTKNRGRLSLRTATDSPADCMPDGR